MNTSAPICLDGLPGPSHSYAGLGSGNVASLTNAGQVSSPRRAALQALDKMQRAHELGVVQYMLPPIPRPDWGLLHAAGFSGKAADVLRHCAHAAPEMLAAAWSSAAMWCANAATCVPPGDTGSTHAAVLVANLSANLHRSREAAARVQQFRHFFAPEFVTVHDPLCSTPAFFDEGTANHTRLWSCADTQRPAVHCFVYGLGGDGEQAQRFMPRQHRHASAAVARQLGIAQPVLIQQHTAAIDAGAFHNDVVMVGSANRVLLHQFAWHDQAAVLKQLRQRIPDLWVEEITENDLPLPAAIRTYLFNSQLFCVDKRWVLLAPAQCRTGDARTVIDGLQRRGFIDQAHFMDVDQSMRGGGGPACMRLRIPFTANAIAAQLRMTPAVIARVQQWARAYYRDELRIQDFQDMALVQEHAAALEALHELLGIAQPAWSKGELCDK